MSRAVLAQFVLVLVAVVGCSAQPDTSTDTPTDPETPPPTATLSVSDDARAAFGRAELIGGNLAVIRVTSVDHDPTGYHQEFQGEDFRLESVSVGATRLAGAGPSQVRLFLIGHETCVSNGDPSRHHICIDVSQPTPTDLEVGQTWVVSVAPYSGEYQDRFTSLAFLRVPDGVQPDAALDALR